MARRLLILLIVACAGILVVAQAAAGGTVGANAPSFALRPLAYDPALPETKSYFVLDARPGAVVNDKVRVTNVGTAPGSVKLYAVDATTGQTSGTVYLNTGAPRRDVGRWVVLGTGLLTLRPHESRVVSFTVRVPAGAHSGDHVGGLVAQNQTLTNPSGGTSALHVQIRHLTVAAVVVRIPGAATPGLSVRRVSAAGGNGYEFVHVALTNTGNVMMKPTGSLILQSAAGRTIANAPLHLDTLVPRTTIAYPVLIRHALRPGHYTASISLSYGNRVLVNGQGVGGPLTYRRTFDFSVSKAQNSQVYVGAPQLTRQSAHAASGLGSRSFLLVLSAVLGILALSAFGFALLVLRRRRAYTVPGP